MEGITNPIPGLRTILTLFHHPLPVCTGMIAIASTDALHPEAPHIVAEMSICVTGMTLAAVQKGRTPGQGGVGGAIEDISVAAPVVVMVVVMVGDEGYAGHYTSSGLGSSIASFTFSFLI